MERRALNVLITLRRAANAVSQCEAALLHCHRLTESQFGGLEALLFLGPMCQRDRVGKILTSTGNPTTMIDELGREDLVVRRRDPGDQRMVAVELTRADRRLIQAVFPAHVAEIVELFAVLSTDEQEQLTQLCRRLGLRQEPHRS